MENTLVLGTFDGVHIAHRALLFQAQKTGGRVIACTFDAPPAYCFKKIDSMLSLPEEKKALLLSAGADEVFMQHFDEISCESVLAENNRCWVQSPIRQKCPRFR